MRRIPSKKRILEALAKTLGSGRTAEGVPVAHGAEGAAFLRFALERWRDKQLRTREMLDIADSLLDGHGVESLRSDNGRAEAYYVNMGDTYDTTVLLDLPRETVFIMSWGDYVEKEERAGNRFR